MRDERIELARQDIQIGERAAERLDEVFDALIDRAALQRRGGRQRLNAEGRQGVQEARINDGAVRQKAEASEKGAGLLRAYAVKKSFNGIGSSALPQERRLACKQNADGRLQNGPRAGCLQRCPGVGYEVSLRTPRDRQKSARRSSKRSPCAATQLRVISGL